MILKGKCKHCGHLFTWNEERYAAGSHVVRCRQCDGFLGGGLKCASCGKAYAMLNDKSAGARCLCGGTMEEPFVDRI